MLDGVIQNQLGVLNENLQLINRCASNESTGAGDNLLNWVDFHIAPVVNPDGYQYSRQVVMKSFNI